MTADGALRGMGASLLSQSTEPVLWADAVQTQQGAHAYVVHERPNHEGSLGGSRSMPRASPRPRHAPSTGRQARGSPRAQEPARSARGARRGRNHRAPSRNGDSAVPVDALGTPASEPVMDPPQGPPISMSTLSHFGSSVYVGWTDCQRAMARSPSRCSMPSARSHNPRVRWSRAQEIKR